MGEALVEGLLRSAWATPDAIVIAEQLSARRAELGALVERHPGLRVVASVGEALEGGIPEGAVIAVKPGDAPAACRALAGSGIVRFLSIAAGVTLAALESWLTASSGGETPAPAVVRAMPNTPALVGAAASAIAPGRAAGPGDLQWAEGILSSVGTVATVGESALDAVTGLSGSGPAYVFLVAEALIDAGVLVGLARPLARQLAVQTLVGSARLLAESGSEPGDLRAAVTSPAGTTAAGLRALEAAGVRGAVLEAVAAATARARELGQA